MKWRITGMLIGLSGALVVLAWWSTPTLDRSAVAPALLVNLAATLILLVPVFFVERRLEQQIADVKVRVDKIAAEFEQTVRLNTDKKIREQWQLFEEAKSSFTASPRGASARTLLELSNSYGLLPERDLRVPLPSKNQAWLRISLPADPDTLGVIARVSTSESGSGAEFQDVLVASWDSEVTLEELLGDQIYRALVRRGMMVAVDQYVMNTDQILRTMTAPLEAQLGISPPVTDVGGTKVLCVPNDQWAICQHGLYCSVAARRIPVKELASLKWRRPWIQAQAIPDEQKLGQALALAQRMPAWYPPKDSLWNRHFREGDAGPVIFLLAILTPLLTLLIFLASNWTPLTRPYLEWLPWAVMILGLTAIAFRMFGDDDYKSGVVIGPWFLLPGLMTLLLQYVGQNTLWLPEPFRKYVLWPQGGVAVVGATLTVATVVMAISALRDRSWRRDHAQLL